jgi:hypothetical protein
MRSLKILHRQYDPLDYAGSFTFHDVRMGEYLFWMLSFDVLSLLVVLGKSLGNISSFTHH